MIAEVPSVTFLRRLQSEHFRTTILPIGHLSLLFEFGDSSSTRELSDVPASAVVEHGPSHYPAPEPRK